MKPIICIVLLLAGAAGQSAAQRASAAAESRPWVYWWWMAGAVDRANLTRELERYQKAGIGGIHIVPIYGAQGYEHRYHDFLSPKWLELLQHGIREAHRLGMGVDMTTGSGWNFGGPNISEDAGCSEIVQHRTTVPPGGTFRGRSHENSRVDALVAFGQDGSWRDLRYLLKKPGLFEWKPGPGTWEVYTLERKPCAQGVERAAPGGNGPLLNPFYRPAMESYLERFTAAFRRLKEAKPRAMYHDSFEYGGDWAPDLLAQFQKRRGYPLEQHLKLLFGSDGGDDAARVKSDYRETISDLMQDEFLEPWVRWSHSQGMLTRNQAHGSPGNWLDLYALADIPETEMFGDQPTILISKFASSAAHVTGKRLTSCETATWLREHFQERLADLKDAADAVFLAGVNHIVFHGTCFSPDDAPWPGWLFYASTQLNPRNPIWADLPSLTAYISRIQGVLQAARPDNDVLVYWPIYDVWHDAQGLKANLSVHNFDNKTGRLPFAGLTRRLWDSGFTFDYISDRQLQACTVRNRLITAGGASYKAVVVPHTGHMPLHTLHKLLDLARRGAAVIFDSDLPADVPGYHRIADRRAELLTLKSKLRFRSGIPNVRRATAGTGMVLTGSVTAALDSVGVRAETLKDQGLDFIRVRGDAGAEYLVFNRKNIRMEGWFPLAHVTAPLIAMDAWTGRTGRPTVRSRAGGGADVYLHLDAGQSVCLRSSVRQAPAWKYFRPSGAAVKLPGPWKVEFLNGGPDLPAAASLPVLRSWTDFGGEAGERFGGTARYTTAFDAPADSAAGWALSLGDVRESARVRLNGHDLGTVIAAPFEIKVAVLRSTGNVLEVEVTNLASNRIRFMDRSGVRWRIFNDINFVNKSYKPFDASSWPVRDSGLLGPVTLQALEHITRR